MLGGDGFCGWPTSLHLSDQGHDVIIVDNLSRRNIDTELGCDSLTPITHPEVRLEAWKELTGKTIHFENLDVATEYDRLELLMKTVRPDSVVHFAEQRAALHAMIAETKTKTLSEKLSTASTALYSFHTGRAPPEDAEPTADGDSRAGSLSPEQTRDLIKRVTDKG